MPHDSPRPLIYTLILERKQLIISSQHFLLAVRSHFSLPSFFPSFLSNYWSLNTPRTILACFLFSFLLSSITSYNNSLLSTLHITQTTFSFQLKCKQTLQIATFNVRTWNRIGQLPELIASAEEHKIDIICIQEHRYTHTEDIKYHETGNGWSLVTVSAWKNSVNAAVGGVGLLIGPRALKTINSVEKIQPRMMAATFNGNPRATIISCYSATNVSEENELVTFYDELSSLVRSIPKHNMLVIGGDMNAQIGKNGNNKYSLHNTSNRNGQHLTDFMIENRLACLNTNYQKREGKLWTYTYANNTKAQIDYVLINKKWKNSAMICEAYSSFDGVSTDHRIVTAKIRLSLRKNDKRTATTKHYD